MSELSVDPRLAKAILASAGELACSQEVVTIVALLSVHSVWAGAHGQRKAQNEAKMRQALPGMLTTLLPLPDIPLHLHQTKASFNLLTFLPFIILIPFSLKASSRRVFTCGV